MVMEAETQQHSELINSHLQAVEALVKCCEVLMGLLGFCCVYICVGILLEIKYDYIYIVIFTIIWTIAKSNSV